MPRPISENPARRGGYAEAVADTLVGIKKRLDQLAGHYQPETYARRSFRLAASYLGQAEELLTYLSRVEDPESSDLTRFHAEAELKRMSEPIGWPQGETPTERGEAAGADVVSWLDDLVGTWPDDHDVVIAGQLVEGPRSGGTAPDFEWKESTNLPIGALVDALRAVARQGGPAAEVVRAILAERGVPASAAYRARERKFMADLDAPRK